MIGSPSRLAAPNQWRFLSKTSETSHGSWLYYSSFDNLLDDLENRHIRRPVTVETSEDRGQTWKTLGVTMAGHPLATPCPHCGWVTPPKPQITNLPRLRQPVAVSMDL